MIPALPLSLLSSPDVASTPKIKVDRMVVTKHTRTLVLLANGKTILTYKISLGGDAIGPKLREGDHKTPEGRLCS